MEPYHQTKSATYICTPSNDTFEINIENTTVNILKVTSKMFYNEFKRKKQTAPSAQKKIKLKYPDLSLEWKEIYSFPFTVIHKLTNFSKITLFLQMKNYS